MCPSMVHSRCTESGIHTELIYNDVFDEESGNMGT